MTIFTKKYALSFPLLIITLMTNGMDKPVAKQLAIVNCQAYIGKGVNGVSVSYATEQQHADILQDHNLKSTIKDPVILIRITDTNANKGFMRLPLKYCRNLNDDSRMQIIDRQCNLFSISNPAPLLINATFVKNPDLAGNDVAEQIENAKKRFYNKAEHYVQNALYHPTSMNEELTRYATAGIIIDDLAWTNEYDRPIKHGINGCPNEDTLMKSEFMTKIPENRSLYASLKKRELTGKF